MKYYCEEHIKENDKELDLDDSFKGVTNHRQNKIMALNMSFHS